MKRLSASLLSLTLLLPGLAAQGTAEELTASDVKGAIDRGLRWVHSQQEENGSYGDDVDTTAAVLTAYGIGPRAYRAGDGPLVDRAVTWLLAQQAEDGSFPSAREGPFWKKRATASVVLALQDVHATDAAGAIERAKAFLQMPEVDRGPGLDSIELSPQVAGNLRKAAWQLYAARNEDGTYGEGEARLATTAFRMAELANHHKILEKLERRDAQPGTVTPLPALEPADLKRIDEAARRGARFLVAASPRGRWGFGDRADPGITAMVAGALLAVPEPRGEGVDEAVESALDWLVSLQREDGSIQDGQLANYVTSASILALSRAGRAKDEPVIARAREFLKDLQADEGEGYSEENRYYGGVGYGDDERPDLSNLQMALEALAASGTKQGDETFTKALVFLQRCQNRSESNDLEFERDGKTYSSGNDGGSGYAPGESKAGFLTLANRHEVPRSYGSMTYALLKSYLFAGLPKDDPRVEAAWQWLREHYTLDVNPGFESSSDPRAAYQGLFYYFYTMARALSLYGDEVVRDTRGGEHAWRAELAARLLAMQRQDGSWINTNAERWYEGNPVLASAYALLALGETRESR